MRALDVMGTDTANREERMAAQARTAAERLSWTLRYAAEQLEVSASLADMHAERHESAGHSDSAAKERRAGNRAREAAQRARLRADHWRRYQPQGAGDERLAAVRGDPEGAEASRARPEESSDALTTRLDARERAADRRDRVADERDAIANERDRLANEREQAADDRERLADELNAQGDGKNGGRRERAEQGAARERAARERDQAAIRREVAATERQRAREQPAG